MFSALPDLLARRAALSGGAPALRELVGGRAVSYAQLDAGAARAAGALAGRGLGAGDRVAVLCRNRIEFFELLFACGKLGAVLVPLNWRMPAGELAPLLADAGAPLLVFGHEDEASARALRESGIALLGLDDDGDAGYRAACAAARPVHGRAFWPAAEAWYLLYTSGTTGTPKGVIQTYGMAVANYVNIRQPMGIGPDDVALNYLPLFHTAGVNLVTLPTLLEGGLVLISPGFDLQRTVQLLAAGALSTFFAVPAVYRQISLHPAFDTLDLSRVRSFGCGGAALPDELVERYLERGARVCNGMGMTETGPTAFIMDPASVAAKIGSVGKPQVLVSVRLVDRDGNDVDDGQQGEVWFAGPAITPGYWRRDAANAEAFTADGWLRSGDIARRDADGYYYVVGRIKDMFISGGENVFPAEVEGALGTHADILEAAVVGVADQQWGEVGCAFLLARPGHTLPSDRSLSAWCRERLAAYKVPKRFVAVRDFPRTAAGKIQKHLLREE